MKRFPGEDKLIFFWNHSGRLFLKLGKQEFSTKNIQPFCVFMVRFFYV